MTDKLQKKFTNRQGKFIKPPKAVFTADSGAQVDCVARNQLKRLGLSEQDLLEAAVTLGCANNTKAGMLGAFWGKVSCEVNLNRGRSQTACWSV